MKYSIFTVIMKEFSLEEAADKLKQYGYNGVEWRVHEAYHIDPETIDKRAKYVKKVTEDNGLEIPALASYISVKKKELIERVLDAARVMGCPQVRVTVPNYDGSIPYPFLYDETLKDLEIIQRIAERIKVKATIEIHFGNITTSPSLAHRLVQNFDSNYIGVIFDPGNMVVEGMESYKLGFQLLGDYLAHVHVKNAAWTKRDGKWIWSWDKLEEGMVDWKAVIEALKDVGYEGYLSSEDFSDQPIEDKLRGNISYLRNL